jgi:hypothetical protein
MTFYPTAMLREIHGEDGKASRLARMLELEDEVYQQASGILRAALDFCHVRPDQAEPPAEWVEQYGLDAAKQRLEVAKQGWAPKSLSASGIDLAKSMVIGISRARRHTAANAGLPREVNAKIALPAPTSAGMPGAPEYPSKEVE